MPADVIAAVSFGVALGQIACNRFKSYHRASSVDGRYEQLKAFLKDVSDEFVRGQPSMIEEEKQVFESRLSVLNTAVMDIAMKIIDNKKQFIYITYHGRAGVLKDNIASLECRIQILRGEILSRTRQNQLAAAIASTVQQSNQSSPLHASPQDLVSIPPEVLDRNSTDITIEANEEARARLQNVGGNAYKAHPGRSRAATITVTDVAATNAHGISELDMEDLRRSAASKLSPSASGSHSSAEGYIEMNTSDHGCTEPSVSTSSQGNGRSISESQPAKPVATSTAEEAETKSLP